MYNELDHVTTMFMQGKDILATLITNIYFKVLLSSLVTVGSVLLGEENYELLLFLIILISFDLITGMIAAVARGEELESRKVFKTATKVFIYLMLFSSAYLTHKIVPFSDFITTGVLSFLALTELLSIMENMAKMGYSLPAKLLNQLRDKAGLGDTAVEVIGEKG